MDKSTKTSWRESRTFRFVSISWLVVTLRFAVGGMDLAVVGVSAEFPVMGAGEYGAAVGVILAIWLGKEFKDIHARNGN